jgi:ribosomal protein S18 acetylase RimI-like enzyme
MELLPASHFSIQELTHLYNQTRVDYLVPMPMTADRLADYVRDFDISLEHSCVARDEQDGEILGLIMMGIRPPLGWVTRLGVLPATRRGGVGGALMENLLSHVAALGLTETHLEVIKNNTPAHNLFVKTGFVETETYLVMRRAPRPLGEITACCASPLNGEQAVGALQTYPHHLTWINAIPSMKNAPDVEGIRVQLDNGGAGWIVFRNQRFSLTHLVLHTEQGDPQEVGAQLLANLHSRYPRHDTYAENILQNDPHLGAFLQLGYFENFSRIEMRRPTPTM